MNPSEGFLLLRGLADVLCYLVMGMKVKMIDSVVLAVVAMKVAIALLLVGTVDAGPVARASVPREETVVEEIVNECD